MKQSISWKGVSGTNSRLFHDTWISFWMLKLWVSQQNLKGLRHLYDLVESHVRSLKSLWVSPNSYGTLLSCWTNSPWRYGLLLAEGSMKTDGVWMPCSRWWKRRSEQGNVRQWTLLLLWRNHQIESKQLPLLYSLVIWPLDWLVATAANRMHHAHVKSWSWWRTDTISSKEVEDALCAKGSHFLELSH